MRFRKLEIADCKALADFFERNDDDSATRHFHPFPLNRLSAEALLKEKRRDSFFALWQEDRIIAFSMLRGFDEGYDIPSFGLLVDRHDRNKGLGRYLSDWTLLWADRSGIEAVRLNVYSDNPRAKALYESLGFSTIESTQLEGRSKSIMRRQRPEERIALYVSLLALKPAESLVERIDQWHRYGLDFIEATWYPNIEDAPPPLELMRNRTVIHNYFPPEPDDPFLNLASPNEANLRRSLEFYENRIDLSRQLNAPWYSIHAGFIGDPIGRDSFGFLFQEPKQGEQIAALDRFANALAALEKQARDSSVSLLVENNVCSKSNRNKLLLVTPEEFQQFRDRYQGEFFRILLDTGHMNVSAKTLEFEASAFLDLASNIEGVHLHQNDGEADQHLPVFANDWPVDFALEVKPRYASLEGRYSSLEELQDAYIEIYRRLNG